MANIAELYNFYFKYRWTAADFESWETSMVEYSRGNFEGLFKSGVMDGLDVSASGLSVNVGAGIACGPTGYLHINEAIVNVPVTPPTGAFPVRSIIVSRPLIEQTNPITRPTVPFDTVFLNEKLNQEVVLIEGTPSSAPDYPVEEVNDIILAGVRMEPSATGISATDLDFTVRDLLGKNTNFQKFQARYDDRCRPFKSTNQILGIKPSQLEAPFPKAFIYVNRSIASTFPNDGSGNYNTADSFLNFQTGAITGGDAATPAFIPTIPTAGKAINAVVSLQPSNILSIVYGTEGTYEECRNGIENQITVGPGSIGGPQDVYRLAFITLRSSDGANITELDFFDGRTTFSASGLQAGIPVGVVLMQAGSSIDAGYLDCDFGESSRVTFADLWARLQTSPGNSPWGNGDLSNTFNRPDLRSRTVVGAGQGVGLSLRTVGQSFGEENHTMTLAEMYQHDHTINHGHADTIGISNAAAEGHDHSSAGTPGLYTRLATTPTNLYMDETSSNIYTSDILNASAMSFTSVTGSRSFGTVVAGRVSTNSGGTSASISGGVTSHSGSSGPKGSTSPFNVVQPSAVVRFMIKF